MKITITEDVRARMSEARLKARRGLNHQRPERPDDLIILYPRLTAHVICRSLGYATPTTAAYIVYDAHRRRQNFCEWIHSCYGGDPLPAVREAVARRQSHKGYMADYVQAMGVVLSQALNGCRPEFASWF